MKIAAKHGWNNVDLRSSGSKSKRKWKKDNVVKKRKKPLNGKRKSNVFVKKKKINLIDHRDPDHHHPMIDADPRLLVLVVVVYHHLDAMVHGDLVVIVACRLIVVILIHVIDGDLARIVADRQCVAVRLRAAHHVILAVADHRPVATLIDLHRAEKSVVHGDHVINLPRVVAHHPEMHGAADHHLDGVEHHLLDVVWDRLIVEDHQWIDAVLLLVVIDHRQDARMDHGVVDQAADHHHQEDPVEEHHRDAVHHHQEPEVEVIQDARHQHENGTSNLVRMAGRLLSTNGDELIKLILSQLWFIQLIPL